MNPTEDTRRADFALSAQEELESRPRWLLRYVAAQIDDLTHPEWWHIMVDLGFFVLFVWFRTASDLHAHLPVRLLSSFFLALTGLCITGWLYHFLVGRWMERRHPA